LRRATVDNLGDVRGLFEDAVGWLRRHKDTDQWETPWPDGESWTRRIRQDLRERKTWLAWDGTTAVGTITLDPNEPVDMRNNPVWPAHKRHELALYVRRVIVSRSYAGLGLGAGLLDWASDVAMRDYDAALIRIDVWTTNRELHDYYLDQRFTRLPDRPPWELDGYPSQALFERAVDQAGSGYTELFAEDEASDADESLYWRTSNIGYLG
jgi:GNAT superfamily N-acetyltransferase